MQGRASAEGLGKTGYELCERNTNTGCTSEEKSNSVNGSKAAFPD